jgi:hypothetical protein
MLVGLKFGAGAGLLNGFGGEPFLVDEVDGVD